jgi:REP element-mobilizing transposase RayT
MSKMYWQLLYHVVWKTKNRAPLLLGEVRILVLKCIRKKCDQLGCKIYALEAVPDHVHMLVAVPPSLSLSDLAMNIKGSSSHLVNHTSATDTTLYWQRGCGMLTISSKDKNQVIAYIQDQERRHQVKDVWPSLERTEGEVSPTESKPTEKPSDASG